MSYCSFQAGINNDLWWPMLYESITDYNKISSELQPEAHSGWTF